MKFTTHKEVKRITKKRNAVLDRKYQRKKPLEEVEEEDARTLLNLFLKKPGMTERSEFIYCRIWTNRSLWLIWQ